MIKKLPAELKNISEFTNLIEENLTKFGLNSNLIKEYMLVSEEIMLKLIEKANPGAELSVNVFKSYGGSNIKFICAGKDIVLEQEDEFDLGGKIIEEYGDSIKQNYKGGVNHISLASSTTESNRFLLDSCLAIIASFITAVILNFALTVEQLDWINSNFVYPIVTTFSACLGTVATPVAFFSLIAFIIAIRLSLESDSRLKVLVWRYSLTSFVAMFFSGLVWLVYDKFDKI